MNKKIISFLFVIMLLFVAMPAFCTGEEEAMEETNEVIKDEEQKRMLQYDYLKYLTPDSKSFISCSP